VSIEQPIHTFHFVRIKSSNAASFSLLLQINGEIVHLHLPFTKYFEYQERIEPGDWY
jgi:hypothetical protein